MDVKENTTGWLFGTFLFSPIVGTMIQSDQYFSEGLKPPIRQTVIMKKEFR
jgi:hypothetical protein